jgi:hypothetical protein
MAFGHVHDDSIRVLDFKSDRRWFLHVIPSFSVEALPNNREAVLLTTAGGFVEIWHADADMQIVQHPAHMGWASRSLVLENSKIVKPVGQVATLSVLGCDLKSKSVSPKPKCPLQIAGSNAHMNEN